MGFEEAMNNGEDTELAEDLLLDEVVEDSEDEGPEESLESITDEGQAAEEQESPKGKQGTGEPGYVQGRIAKAVQKAVAETEARLTAQFEAQYAPIRERMLEMEAQDLVKKGDVKNLEIAKELVRARQGMPAQQPTGQSAQPRQANGQFASAQDAKMNARLEILAEQADKLSAKIGVDLIDVMKSDMKIRDKILSGKMDFYDLAEQVKNQPTKKKPPAPMRSPNGVNGQIKGTIMSMSDKQFEELEKRVKAGGVRFRE